MESDGGMDTFLSVILHDCRPDLSEKECLAFVGDIDYETTGKIIDVAMGGASGTPVSRKSNELLLVGPKGIEATATERITRVGLQVIDRITRDAIFLGGTPFFPNTETNRSGLDNNDYVISTDLQKLYSTMRKNLVPTFDDGSYMLFVSEEVAYDLKRDSTSGNNWIEINKYTTTEPIMSGEIGKYHGFRIVPTTTNPTVSSSVTVSLSLAVGNIKGWGAGNLQTFRTYHKAPGGDHDDLLEQEELMGWKVMFGVATLNNDYYYRLESYASTL